MLTSGMPILIPKTPQEKMGRSQNGIRLLPYHLIHESNTAPGNVDVSTTPHYKTTLERRNCQPTTPQHTPVKSFIRPNSCSHKNRGPCSQRRTTSSRSPQSQINPLTKKHPKIGRRPISRPVVGNASFASAAAPGFSQVSPSPSSHYPSPCTRSGSLP